MRILGIDPSLNATALILLVDGVVVKKFAITNKFKDVDTQDTHISSFNMKKINNLDRLILIREYVKNVINNTSPDAIAIEDYALGSKFATINTGEIGGILRLIAYESNIPLRLYAPTKVKKFATGSGAAPKSSVCVSVFKTWSQDFTEYKELGEDFADAFAIGKLLEYELLAKKDKSFLSQKPDYMKSVLQDSGKKEKSLLETDLIIRYRGDKKI